MNNRGALKNLVLALLVIIGYALCRFIIYTYFVIESTHDWILRDALMNIPRLAGALVSLYLGYKIWGWKSFGFDGKWSWAAVLVGAALLLMEFSFSFLGSRAFQPTGYFLLIFYISSFIVGFFEEILFRGVLLNALRDWRGDFIALWGSSFFFTLYHIQAQSYFSWPGIFIFGWIMALLRMNGISMIWLIFIHGFYDCVGGIVGRIVDIDMIPLHSLTSTMIAIGLVVYIRLNKGAGQKKVVNS